jgi:hypothetical protein
MPGFGRIEAEEIDRLAHFEHCVDQRLSGLANAEPRLQLTLRL